MTPTAGESGPSGSGVSPGDAVSPRASTDAGGSGGSSPRASTEQEAEQIRADASDVLRLAGSWELPPGRWAEFAEILEVAIAAHAAADGQALGQAVAHLEQLGPMRVARIGGDSLREPPPGPVRERVDYLIRALGAGRYR